MTQVDIHEDINSIAFGELNYGDVFERRGKVYIKYFDTNLKSAFGLQIYPPDNLQFHCEDFLNEEGVFEKDCTIEIT